MIHRTRTASPWVRIFWGLSVWAGAILLPGIITAQGSVFDAIQPGKSTRSDVYGRFGEPVRSETSGDFKLEHFNDDEKLFKEVSAWFNDQNVLQWVRVRPLHKVNADDALMLFGLATEPNKTEGHAFDEKQITKGETQHFPFEGVYFYVHKGVALEIWLTQAEADSENIMAVLNQPTSELPQRSDPQTLQDIGQQQRIDPNKNVDHQNKNMGPKILFMDDFNSENDGRGKLNYRGFENWEVSSGELDLIGNGFWDFHPDYGLHLDLDGSVNKAGTLQSKTKFRLLPGVYTLEFDLAGNFQRTVNTVRVSMGDLYNEEFTLQAKEAFRKIKREINVSSVLEARLIFQHRGGDNFGLLLDNVRLIKTAGQESLKEVVIGDNLRKKTLSRDQEMLKTARQLLNKKDYDKAIGQFRKTIDSLRFQSFQGLGLCYYYKKYFDDAFYYFAKAYKEDPRSPLTLFYMAATLDQWGKGLEAIFCFESYLKLNDPDKNRREIAQQRWQYLKRRSQRPGHALYRSVDEVIYVILGEEIN